MADKKTSAKANDLTDADVSSKSGDYQNYYLPEYNIAVKARSASEATSKAQKQINNEGSK